MSEESPHTNHLNWGDLPARSRSAIESLVGRVGTAVPDDAGLNAHLASTLHVPGGKVFIKGLPSNHKTAYRQNNEATIGPSVREISPTVLHHGDTGEWNFLVFEHFEGRHANLAPESPDLVAIPSMLHKLLATAEHDTSVSLPVEERWARFGDGLNLSLLAGDCLVHTDLNKRNILMGKTRSVLVDWSLPGRGASWLNVAFMISSLISEGCSPAQAERWAQDFFEEWRRTDSAAIDTFVQALLRRREEQAVMCSEPRRAERRRLAQLAQQWLQHRGQAP
ncbi:hypothetical protein [Embleya sp. NBC_00896]|uniref:hypothetical protein n=1 Tax=Embleya sp. NBC_00896 TaxID=2975961 RepID=UPI003866B032|nr:hypothetical protein OG928_47560 [Embleya sp. NBC_00896]